MDTKSRGSVNLLERGDVPGSSDYRILIVGKTGNGKSTLGNAILGRDEFDTGHSMSSTTLRMQEASTYKHGKQVKVVDTPDIINVEDMNTESMHEAVSRWKHCTDPYPSAILLAVRCDVRYTAEEYDIYRRIKLCWGDDASFCSRLIVVFTFGDRQDGDIEEDLKTVCPELKRVLKDANNRYVVSNKLSDENADMLWRSLDGHMCEMRSPTENIQHCKTRLIASVMVLVCFFNVFLVALLVIVFISLDRAAVITLCVFLGLTALMVLIILCLIQLEITSACICGLINRLFSRCISALCAVR